MRNIHILPTDKPSRLYINVLGYLSFDSLQFRVSNQNIYITNDEKIKDGDWNLFLLTNTIHKFKKLDCSQNHIKGSKKIILTDNKDLIKDGVKSIDDEFLEWFAKNPNCEEVEVRYTVDFNSKAVIIPKEETTLKLPSLPYDYEPLINKNQETLEENSFTLLEKELIKEAKKVWKESHPNPIEMALFGANFQQERLYTEEEVVNIAKLSYNNARVATGNHEVSFNMWFDTWFKNYKK